MIKGLCKLLTIAEYMYMMTCSNTMLKEDVDLIMIIHATIASGLPSKDQNLPLCSNVLLLTKLRHRLMDSSG